MNTQRKVAGHIMYGKLATAFDCAVLTGRMLDDKRETDCHGDPRDFSGHTVRTSWVETLEYQASCDTTVVYTRNSIYYTQGNLIEKHLNEPEGTILVDGRSVIYQSMVA